MLCRFITVAYERPWIAGAHESALIAVPRDITLAMSNVLDYRYTLRGFASVNYPDEAVSDLARVLFGDGTKLRAERL